MCEQLAQSHYVTNMDRIERFNAQKHVVSGTDVNFEGLDEDMPPKTHFLGT